MKMFQSCLPSRYVLSFALVVLAPIHDVRAQGVAVTGIVADTNGVPVDSAEISIAVLGVKTRSASDGTFHFSNVSPGEYEIRARKIGLLPQVRKIRIGSANAMVSFSLLPTAQLLPVTVVTASRGGLSGVVGDTSFRALDSAQVRVLATNAFTTTDSLGAFHLDVKPGTYMLRVERAGYTARMVSVTVPRDSGRRITVMLPPQVGNGVLLSNAAKDMSMRLNRRTVTYSKMYSRDDLDRLGFEELSDIYARNAPRPVSDRCEALINGGPQTAPIWSIKAENLEFVEVYWSPPPRQTSTSIYAKPAMGVPATAESCKDVVVAWLRR